LPPLELRSGYALVFAIKRWSIPAEKVTKLATIA